MERDVGTEPLRELAARRMRPGTTRELLLRLPNRIAPEKLVERLASILEVAELEAEADRTAVAGEASRRAK